MIFFMLFLKRTQERTEKKPKKELVNCFFVWQPKNKLCCYLIKMMNYTQNVRFLVQM